MKNNKLSQKIKLNPKLTQEEEVLIQQLHHLILN